MTKQTFTELVREVVSKIPKGKTMTYLEVAKKAGKPKAYRAVGSVMKKNFDKNIPCHRVIRSDGKAGKYNRGDLNKIRLLRKEGVKI